MGPSSIPLPGLGVYKIRGEACTTACLAALAAGYRHVDTAQLYQNEAQVGEAVRQSGVRRDDIFLTTKISLITKTGKTKATDSDTYQSAVESVTKLAGEDGYVDLFLVHVPASSRAQREEQWGVLERLREEGKARFIGVSNFREHHLEEMKEYAAIWPPAVNQIEVKDFTRPSMSPIKLTHCTQLHPWCQQKGLVKYCQQNNILIEAYSPLVTGKRMDDPTLSAMAKKHDKSTAQVLIRYSIQKGWIPLPKSKTPGRIKENLDVSSFSLDKDDMEALDGLDEGSKGACFPKNVDS